MKGDKTMRAFHNDPAIREKYMARLRAHAEADEIVKGQYWQNGKGCAVGCTIHGSDHQAYETELGIPVALAMLEDRIFENLPSTLAMKWPLRFLGAFETGVDYSRVSWKFLYWLQTKNLAFAEAQKMSDDVIMAIKLCADVLLSLTRGESVDPGAVRSVAWSAAWSAAESAAWSAWSAASAESAAESAWSAARSAESAAESAWSAARSAESAAESAWSAARSAASAWSAARSAESAAWGAESAAWVEMADKLVLLIETEGAVP